MADPLGRSHDLPQVDRRFAERAASGRRARILVAGALVGLALGALAATFVGPDCSGSSTGLCERKAQVGRVLTLLAGGAVVGFYAATFVGGARGTRDPLRGRRPLRPSPWRAPLLPPAAVAASRRLREREARVMRPDVVQAVGVVRLPDAALAAFAAARDGPPLDF